jgi:hypothetical protein
VRHWQQAYAAFQGRCREAFGTTPVHTFFYPPHHGPEHLPQLAEMAHAGGGEIELHYHHRDDTAESLTRDLKATLALYNRHGLLLESGHPPRTSFGFVHGDWALNNSCGGECAGQRRVSIHHDLGCWATSRCPRRRLPTRKIARSITVWAIRPAQGDAAVGCAHGGETPGAVHDAGPARDQLAPDHPRPENANLTSRNWGRPDRLPVWLNCNVHVEGRRRLFIKLHAWAIERDFDALFGDKAFAMHRASRAVQRRQAFQLHYVTARQAYNVAKAAEDSKSETRQVNDHHPAAGHATTRWRLGQVVACGKPWHCATSKPGAGPAAVRGRCDRRWSAVGCAPSTSTAQPACCGSRRTATPAPSGRARVAGHAWNCRVRHWSRRPRTARVSCC